MKIYNITATSFERYRSQNSGEWMIKIKMFEGHLVRHIEYLSLDSSNKFVKQKAEQFVKNLLKDPDDLARLSEKNKSVDAIFTALVDLPHHFKEISQIEIDTTGEFTRIINVEYK